MSSPTTVNELLKAAKSLFESYGHAKGQYLSPEGRLCPSGAIIAAQLNGDDPVGRLRDFLSRRGTQPHNIHTHEAAKLRGEANQAMGFSNFGTDLVAHNDLPSTTKEDVLEWFDRGIQQTEPEEAE